MPEYTASPVSYDLTQVIGDTFLLQVALADSADDPYDLTDVEIVASVRTEPGGVVAFTPTATVTDAAGGEFELSADAEDTAELTPGVYRYAVRLTWPDGTVRTVIEGSLSARRVAI